MKTAKEILDNVLQDTKSDSFIRFYESKVLEAMQDYADQFNKPIAI